MGTGWQFRDQGMVVVLVHHDHIKKKICSEKQGGAPLPPLMVSLGDAIYFPANELFLVASFVIVQYELFLVVSSLLAKWVAK